MDYVDQLKHRNKRRDRSDKLKLRLGINHPEVKQVIEEEKEVNICNTILKYNFFFFFFLLTIYCNTYRFLNHCQKVKKNSINVKKRSKKKSMYLTYKKVKI